MQIHGICKNHLLRLYLAAYFRDKTPKRILCFLVKKQILPSTQICPRITTSDYSTGRENSCLLLKVFEQSSWSQITWSPPTEFSEKPPYVRSATKKILLRLFGESEIIWSYVINSALYREKQTRTLLAGTTVGRDTRAGKCLSMELMMEIKSAIFPLLNPVHRKRGIWLRSAYYEDLN